MYSVYARLAHSITQFITICDYYMIQDKSEGSDVNQLEMNERMASYPAIVRIYIGTICHSWFTVSNTTLNIYTIQKLTAEERRKLEDPLAKFEENAEVTLFHHFSPLCLRVLCTQNITNTIFLL